MILSFNFPVLGEASFSSETDNFVLYMTFVLYMSLPQNVSKNDGEPAPILPQVSFLAHPWGAYII
jgi:hypothetical protein